MTRQGASLTARDLGLLGDDEAVLDVLDLPQLYTRPSAKTLLSTLADISSEPPSWEATPRNGTPRSGTPRSPLSGASTPARRRRKVKSEGLPSYLTKIISSPLVWIEDDEEKERIWEAASQRLSERSGRTAMGAITRSFVIPLAANAAESHTADGIAHDSSAENTGADANVNADAKDDDECIEIHLHEPALTADHLGLKTWASSYLLAKRLTVLRATLPSLPRDSLILELGAGTGLVGMTAAAVFAAHTVLTDLPDIVPNLERNVQGNVNVIAMRGGNVEVGTLDWSDPAAFTRSSSSSSSSPAPNNQSGPRCFPLILVADPIYSPEHPALLVHAIDYHLAQNGDARVIVELPLRDAFGAERKDFRTRMAGLGLGVLQEGEEVGFDDWSSTTDEDDLAEVRCWWSVWAWR